MFNDVDRHVTGAEPYPFEGDFPIKEEHLDDQYQKILRDLYSSLYGEEVSAFEDQNRKIVTYGSGFIGGERFSTARGRSDRSAFILFKDQFGHPHPAKVNT